MQYADGKVGPSGVARIAGLVVDWHRPAETLDALHSLAGSTRRPDYLICVENDPTADELALMKEKAPRGTIILPMTDNIGFSSAVNIGMSRAIREGAHWTLVLNNDATIAPNCLQRCLDEGLGYDRVAIVGPAIAFADDPKTLWFAGGNVHPWFAFTRHRGLMRSALTPPPSSDTEFVAGCCAFISTAAWTAIGQFRGEYFIYYEDAEWCQRARAAGWHCRYVGEVLCQHAVGLTMSRAGSLGLSENAAYYLARNPLRFALETRDWIRRFSRVAGLMVVWNGYNGWRLLQSRSISVARAYLEGLRDGMRGRMGRRPALRRTGIASARLSGTPESKGE